MKYIVKAVDAILELKAFIDQSIPQEGKSLGELQKKAYNAIKEIYLQDPSLVEGILAPLNLPKTIISMLADAADRDGLTKLAKIILDTNQNEGKEIEEEEDRMKDLFYALLAAYKDLRNIGTKTLEFMLEAAKKLGEKLLANKIQAELDRRQAEKTQSTEDGFSL